MTDDQMKKPKENYEYNPKRRKLAKIYFKQKIIMMLGNHFVIPVVATILLFLLGYFKHLSEFSTSFAGGFWGILLFVFLISITSQLIEFPLSFYGSYIYEHKYKLSKYTLKGWFVDYGKEFLLGIIIGLPVAFITAYWLTTTPLWWLYVTLLMVAFNIFIDYIYSITILPFMYKLYPYADKAELKKILEICKKCGANNIHNVKVIKESEKSVKPNAFFVGFGRNKIICLYDTLLNQLTKREIRTVIGHEVGHYVKRHVFKHLALSAIETLGILFVANTVIRSSFEITGAGIPLELVPIISVTTTIIGFMIMPIAMSYSRKHEFEADTFALDHVKDPLAQISSEKRLDDLALGDNKPHPLVEFWMLSHPCGSKRIKNVEAWMAKNKH